jgi:hypothetical protein
MLIAGHSKPGAKREAKARSFRESTEHVQYDRRSGYGITVAALMLIGLWLMLWAFAFE